MSGKRYNINMLQVESQMLNLALKSQSAAASAGEVNWLGKTPIFMGRGQAVRVSRY